MSIKIPVKYLHTIIHILIRKLLQKIFFAESVLLKSNYCKHPGDRAKMTFTN